MAASLAATIRTLIAGHTMLVPGAPVVVAVSGGPDSLCLLHVLVSLRDDLGVALHVAHLDHMIRGAESVAEATFVGDIARRWGIPAVIEAIDVQTLARERRANLSETARLVRYQFLARVARSVGAQAVAVAHNADDQAETVLLHLLRGAGPDGLRGMLPVVPWEAWSHDLRFTTRSLHSGQVYDLRLAVSAEENPISNLQSLISGPQLIRPLLTTPRVEIERYCAEQGLDPRCDPTNADRHYMRSRIRHDLLPLLIEYNPHIVTALGRTAAVCAEDGAFVQAALDAVWPELVVIRADGIDFDGAAWRDLHPALQRAALRRGHALLARSPTNGGSGATLGLDHVEQARAAIGLGVGKAITLPGNLTLTVGYDGAFTLGIPVVAGPQLAMEEQVLPVPGRILLAPGWSLETAIHPGPVPRPSSAWEVYLDADLLVSPALVRRRRPGDRIRPAGGRGSRRLQDLFVDAKVPRALRDAWPVIATPAGPIWVVGLRAAEGFIATPTTKRVLHVRAIPHED